MSLSVGKTLVFQCNKRQNLILVNPLGLEGTSRGQLVQPPGQGRVQREQVAQDLGQLVKGWKFLNLPGQPVALFDHPHSKNSLPFISWDFLCSNLCLLLLFLRLWNSQMSLTPSSLHHPIK